MRSEFQIVLNRTTERIVTSAEEVDLLCEELAQTPVFTVRVTAQDGPQVSLELIAESGRAIADYVDMDGGIKLASRDETCTQRGIVSLRNDDYPELELDQIEVAHRSLISPERALAILNRFLKTGEPTDMVAWPSDDEDYWLGDLVPDDTTSDDIPF